MSTATYAEVTVVAHANVASIGHMALRSPQLNYAGLRQRWCAVVLCALLAFVLAGCATTTPVTVTAYPRDADIYVDWEKAGTDRAIIPLDKYEGHIFIARKGTSSDVRWVSSNTSAAKMITSVIPLVAVWNLATDSGPFELETDQVTLRVPAEGPSALAYLVHDTNFSIVRVDEKVNRTKEPIIELAPGKHIIVFTSPGVTGTFNLALVAQPGQIYRLGKYATGPTTVTRSYPGTCYSTPIEFKLKQWPDNYAVEYGILSGMMQE